MKLQVLLALVATTTVSATAAIKDGCYKAADGKDAVADCKCHKDCGICVGADKDAAAKAIACSTCTDAKKKTKDGKVGACEAKEGATDAKKGKAAKGDKCDQNAADSGCAEGLQCGKTTAKASGDDTKTETQKCYDAEGCKADGVTCGALKLGASLASAFAMAYYM